ncbi:uncharacterized protein LOC116287665 [Actinia tenebrosa]|uniref:Uncharacterized protein LOC116287665 n=1 Tax=Actinia tenebrosa TaxID=6105 RepID=A0A6P8H434_ACTTE|nr:uncharacterized protein LOC116287665 [Actinia tenebrosa]
MEKIFLLVFIHMLGFSHQLPPYVDPDRLSKSAKFVPDLDHKLQVTPLKTYNVKDIFECTLECLGQDGCLSINFAKNTVGGLKLCQLLPIDKKDSIADLVASADFHYYDSGLGLPKHCADAKKRDPSVKSGNYRIRLPNREIEVYCDMENFGKSQCQILVACIT